MPTSVPYDDYLIEALKDPEHAEGYLNAALEDEDPRVFLLALRDVARARGCMRKAAVRSQLNGERFRRMLSKKENTRIQDLSGLLDSLGFRLAVELKRAA